MFLGKIFLDVLNKLVVSLLITLAFYHEAVLTDQLPERLFYLKLFLVIFVASAIISFTLKKFTKYKLSSQNTKTEWSPIFLGPKRSFELYKPPSTPSFRFDVDAILLIISAVAFIGVQIIVPALAQKGVIEIKVIKFDAYAYSLLLFFSYSIILVSSYLYYYEKYLAIKKGSGNVSSGIKLAYIFSMGFSLMVLVYASMVSINAIVSGT